MGRRASGLWRWREPPFAAGCHYSLTQVGFDLGDALAGQTLTNATITSNGFESLILGATVVSADAAGAVPEPASWALSIAGFGLVGAAMRRRGTVVRFA